MKKIINIMTIVLAACAAFVSVSCDKNTDTNADPVVRFVKPCDPAIGDRLLTEVAMGGTVAVIGEGLGDVCKIAFNDQVCKLNPAFVTPTSIIVTVPSAMPQVITNKMYLETMGGKKAEFDIAVLIPAPVIESLSCLYAPAGAEMVLKGKYFFADDNGLVAVEFPGGVAAEVKSVTETEVVCIVPEGALLEGAISVTSKYGTSRSTDIWRTSEGIFEKFDNNANMYWSYGAIGTEGGVDGNYLLLDGPVGNWLWGSGVQMLYWHNPSRTPLVEEGEVADYALQFEYCCDSWPGEQMIMWFTSVAKDNVHSIDEDEAQYHWKLFNDGFTPGQWCTLTIPLTDFNTNKEESEVRSIKGLHELVDFHMMPFGASEVEGNIYMKIDNLRLISIK